MNTLTADTLVLLAALALVLLLLVLLLVRRPVWARVQRWLMGTVLAALAVRMLTEARR